MDPKLKRRLLIATIIVALVVIFLPIPFGHIKVQDHHLNTPIQKIPDQPKVDENAMDTDAPALVDTKGSDDIVMPPQPAAKLIVTNQSLSVSQASVVQGSEPPKTSLGSSGLGKAIPAPEKTQHPKALPSDNLSLPGQDPKAIAKETMILPQHWIVQVASFPDRQLSDDLALKLRKEGYPAYVVKALVKGKATYRVYVGPYLQKETADRKQAKIANDLKISGYVHSLKE